MNVLCPTCRTSHTLPESAIPDDGLAIVCPSCEPSFRAFPTGLTTVDSGATAVDAVKPPQPPPSFSPPPLVGTSIGSKPSTLAVQDFNGDQCVILSSLQCVDAFGEVTERYDTLAVAVEDLPDFANNKRVSFRDAVLSVESRGDGWFLPSMPLLWNIALQVLRCVGRSDLVGHPAAHRLLKNFGQVDHMSNTVVEYSRGLLIDYPQLPDENLDAGINVDRVGIEAAFNYSRLLTRGSGEAAEWEAFVKHLTGLENMEQFNEVARHFRSDEWRPVQPGVIEIASRNLLKYRPYFPAITRLEGGREGIEARPGNTGIPLAVKAI